MNIDKQDENDDCGETKREENEKKKQNELWKYRMQGIIEL